MARAKKGESKTKARLAAQEKVFDYLYAKNIEFESTKKVNLPTNKEGGINISQLCKDLGFTASQRTNHVYKDNDIKHEINLHAVAQGIDPIDGDKYKKSINAETSQLVTMSAKRAKQSQDQLAELQSAYEQVLMELKKVKGERDSYKAQMEAFYETGQMPSLLMEEK